MTDGLWQALAAIGDRFRSKIAAGKRTLRERPPAHLVMLLVPSLFLAIVVAVPLVYFVWGSVWTTSPGFGGRFTLAGYETVLTSSGVRDTLANTFILVVVGTSTAVAVGLAAIVFTVKTDLPGWLRSFVSAVLVVQLLLPTFILGLAWEFYFGPNAPVNQLLMLLPMVGSPVVGPNNIWTIAFVFGTHYGGLVYLLTNAAVKAIPQDVEEVGLISGASERAVLARIDFRLAAPSLLIAIAIVLVRALQSFGLPLVLGLPENVYTVATLLYFELNEFPRNFTFIAALGVLILLLSLWLLLVQKHLTGDRGRYETVMGSGESGGTLTFFHNRWFAGGFLCFVFGVYLMPMVTVIVGSLQQTWVGIRPRFVTWSFDGYRTLLVGQNADLFYESILNASVLGVSTGTLALTLGVMVSYLSVKTDWRARVLPDTLSYAPIAIPGIVLASALQWLILSYNDVLGLLYGSLAVLVIVYTGKFMLFGVRASNSSLRSIGQNLEEAGLIAGAGPTTVIRKIYAPLMAPGLLSGFVIVVIVTTKSLAIPLILTGNQLPIIQTTVWYFIYQSEFNVAAAYTVLLVIAFSLVYAVAYRLNIDLTSA